MSIQTSFEQSVQHYAENAPWKGNVEVVLRCYLNTGEFFEVPMNDGEGAFRRGSDLATLCNLRVYVCNPSTGEEIYRVPSRFADIDRAMMAHPGVDKADRLPEIKDILSANIAFEALREKAQELKS